MIIVTQLILECNKCIWAVGDHYCMIDTSLGFHWSRSLGIFSTADGVWSDLKFSNLANTCGQNSDVLLNIAKHWDATDFGTFRHEVDRLHFPFQLEPLSGDKWGKRMQTPLTNGLLGIYDLAKAKINIRKQLLATNDCMTAKKYHKVICHQTREIQEWTLPFMFPCCLASFSVHPKMMFYDGLYIHMGVWYFIKPLPVGFEDPYAGCTCSLCSKSEIRCSKCEKVSAGRHDMATAVSRDEKRQRDLGKLNVTVSTYPFPTKIGLQVVVVNWLQVNFKWRTWLWGPLLCFMVFQFSTSRHSMFSASWPQTAFKCDFADKGSL